MSPCRPKPNRTYLAIGQDYFSIQQHVLEQYNASWHRNGTDSSSRFFHHPAATMAYTDIQTLRGLDEPVDYGSGVEYASGLAEAFPASGLQLGLWLNGTDGCRQVVDGALRENAKRLFRYLMHLPVEKIFLRVGYGAYKVFRFHS